MATKKVFQVEEIELLDGRKVILRPLSITAQRGFYKKLEAQRETDSETIMSDSLDFVAELAIYCLGYMNGTKEMTSEEIEEILDQDTSLFVIKVCGGVDLSAENPKVMEAMGEV